MDELDNNQPLDSMGEPITPLGDRPVNPYAPNNMNNPVNAPETFDKITGIAGRMTSVK